MSKELFLQFLTQIIKVPTKRNLFQTKTFKNESFWSRIVKLDFGFTFFNKEDACVVDFDRMWKSWDYKYEVTIVISY